LLQNADIFEYGPVKGTMVLKPYGFSIWKAIMNDLGARINALGCNDCYFPSLIPLSFLSMEQEHVEGFSPELAVITKAGGKELEEAVVVRPTSETIMYHFFSKWISSWRDLPLKVNQWVNVIRWEMRNFPLLRGTEFLWHEAHTAHESFEESEKTVHDAINMYKSFFEDLLAIPVIIGKKTPREKFAGALYSTSCEALLMDKRGLQIGTAHNLGQNFSKSFNITFQTREMNRGYVWNTSWGVSTRAMGGCSLLMLIKMDS
jgi:prolyl-tRNA synthetase